MIGMSQIWNRQISNSTLGLVEKSHLFTKDKEKWGFEISKTFFSSCSKLKTDEKIIRKKKLTKLEACAEKGISSLPHLEPWEGSPSPSPSTSSPSPSLSLPLLPAQTNYVSAAVEVLKREEVIALPSDTVYGLVGDACSRKSVQRIYEIKGRDLTKPLAVCVAEIADVAKYASTEHLPPGMLRDLLPGPVTLILPRGDDSPLDRSLNPGIKSIGIRIPDSLFIREVAKRFNGALALTSANTSGQKSTVRTDEFKDLWGKCGAVFDGGILREGREGSTIVDLTKKGQFSIVRKGSALVETVTILRKKYKLQAITSSD